MKKIVSISECSKNTIKNFSVEKSIALKNMLTLLEHFDFIPDEISVGDQRSVVQIIGGDWILLSRKVEVSIIEPEIFVLVEEIFSVDQFRAFWSNSSINKKSYHKDNLKLFMQLFECFRAVDQHKNFIGVIFGSVLIIYYVIASQVGIGNLTPKIKLEPSMPKSKLSTILDVKHTLHL